MNRLEAKLQRTANVTDEHLVLVIDGRPLHRIVAELAPERELEGLVPTFLDWFEDPRERALVRSRAVLAAGGSAVLPVLMCPDDLDLWCTVGVAEVASDDQRVFWRRLGIDETSREALVRGEVGEDVAWLAGAGPFEFDRASYERCVAAFW